MIGPRTSVAATAAIANAPIAPSNQSERSQPGIRARTRSTNAAYIAG